MPNDTDVAVTFCQGRPCNLIASGLKWRRCCLLLSMCSKALHETMQLDCIRSEVEKVLPSFVNVFHSLAYNEDVHTYPPVLQHSLAVSIRQKCPQLVKPTSHYVNMSFMPTHTQCDSN